jgi:tellurite resistance protein TehA-like permease
VSNCINYEQITLSENATPELNKEIGPNWFASVMGTGITATAAVGLPLFGEHLTYVDLGLWLLASLMLVVMLTLKIAQTIFKVHIIKRQFNDPVMV